MDSGTSNVPLPEDTITGGLPITESVAVTGVVNSLPTLLPIAMKLRRSNYNFWKSQIMPTLRAYDLEGFITGSMTCPLKVIEAKSDTSEDMIHAIADSPRISQQQNSPSSYNQPQITPSSFSQPGNSPSPFVPSAVSTQQQDNKLADTDDKLADLPQLCLREDIKKAF
ncbi:Retrotransposon gag domain-containing protein [Forsythia ovata]|uniref:Retrotransposon gag domain-containing protein n=1 Tax=Forsythia ovata TaxID=205694 RepID=A0ABD1UZF4_9LAMI